MRLTGVTWYGYELPFVHKYVTSAGGAESRFGLILFLQTAEGITGIGEASPVGPSGRAEIAGVAGALAGLAPHLQGADTVSIENKLQTWDIPSPLRFGLETALLDIAGKSSGCAVAALLGGVASSLAVNATISAESIEQAVAEAVAAADGGFSCLKLKVGRGDVARDEALVSAVRRAVGAGMKLRLDPNQAWSVDQAIESLRRLAQYGIEYVEQPVAAADVDGLAEVRRATGIPIAADESLRSMEDLQRLLKADAADIFILKAARLGGLRTARAIAGAAVAARRRVVVTTSLESGVGAAACVHLAASLPPDAAAHGLATGLLFSNGITEPSLLPERGRVRTPSGPGLGIRVNGAMLRKHGIGITGSIGSPYDWQA